MLWAVKRAVFMDYAELVYCHTISITLNRAGYKGSSKLLASNSSLNYIKNWNILKENMSYANPLGVSLKNILLFKKKYSKLSAKNSNTYFSENYPFLYTLFFWCKIQWWSNSITWTIEIKTLNKTAKRHFWCILNIKLIIRRLCSKKVAKLLKKKKLFQNKILKQAIKMSPFCKILKLSEAFKIILNLPYIFSNCQSL